MPEPKSNKGGARPGSGPKPLPDHLKRKQRAIYVTDAEFEKVKELIATLREYVQKETGQ